MMRYRLDGADAETGEDRSIVLDASSEADARARAEELGLKVAQVRPYETPADTSLRPYRGLNACAAACFWVAGLAWLAAACALAVAPAACSTTGSGETAVVALLVAIGFGLSGLLFAALGHILLTLRDIAINTGREEES